MVDYWPEIGLKQKKIRFSFSFCWPQKGEIVEKRGETSLICALFEIILISDISLTKVNKSKQLDSIHNHDLRMISVINYY